MRKHITFNNVASSHDKHEGACAIMHNIRSENGVLKPTAIHCENTGTLGEGMHLVAAHNGEGFCHLIIEQDNGEGYCNYLWTEENTENPTPLLYNVPRFNDFANMGDYLCLIGDNNIVVALWMKNENRYLVIQRDDMLYDIQVSQDMQERVTVATPITPTVERLLLAEGQGTERLQETIEHDIDQACTIRGGGCFKHICLAIAAIRLNDGSHIMFSNIFALMPADMTTTINVDYDNNVLTTVAYLHRHTISIDMRNRECLDTAMMAGVDIFMSKPLCFIDKDNVVTQKNNEGKVTSVSFGFQNRRDTMQTIDDASFHYAMTITRQQLGMTLAVDNIAPNSKPVCLTDLQRTAMGAKWAYCHNHHLSVGNMAQVLYNPLEIGVSYKFATLSREERLQLTPAQQQEALTGEWMAGSRADIDDYPYGKTANIVVRAVTDDDNIRVTWWNGHTQYPLPGMMMFPDGHVRELEYHIRIDNGNETHFFKTRQTLETCQNKGLAVAIHSPRGLTHRVARPAFLSLLLQQQRVLTYDDTDGSYCTNYELWEEESEEEYMLNHEKAKQSWSMTRQQSLLCTSCQDNPLVFPQESRVTVGDGRLLYMQANTRRTADGLFGDGQYHAFTNQGVYVLRLYGGKWQARQAVTRMTMVEGCRPVATNDAVAFVATRGVMVVKGSSCNCISDNLSDLSLEWKTLPRIREILDTEPDIGIDTLDDFKFKPEQVRQIIYDNTNDQLWLLHDDGKTQLWWTCSLKEMTWATAKTTVTHVVGNGNICWASCKDDNNMVGRLTFGTRDRMPVLIITQPLHLEALHIRKTVQRLIIRGLFTDKGKDGSHLGLALYGSNDLTHWHLAGTSNNIYYQQRSGTPYAWLRLVVTGRLLPSENIEGASMEYMTKFNRHIR